jgi:hypothetical protein
LSAICCFWAGECRGSYARDSCNAENDCGCCGKFANRRERGESRIHQGLTGGSFLAGLLSEAHVASVLGEVFGFTVLGVGTNLRIMWFQGELG